MDNHSAFTIYPNPFSNSFTIELSIPQSESVTLFLTDLTGRMIQTIASNQRFDEGIHAITLETGTLGAGIYFCTLKKQSGLTETKKVVKAGG